MDFREVCKDEYKECAELLAKSFLDYDYFKVIMDDKIKLYKYLKKLMYVGIKTYTSSGGVQLGCYENGKLIATATLLSPAYKPAGVIRYIANGGISVALAGGIFKSLKWLKMDDDANEFIRSISDPHWIMEMLVVATELQGKHIGTDMLQEYIIPYIKDRNGKKLLLITNSEKNCLFYEKNGFKEIESHLLSFGKKRVMNWSYEINF